MTRIIGLALALALAGAAASAQTPPAWVPNDYAKPETWLCRPGRESGCTDNLDAMRVDAMGVRTPAPFTPAADPPIDCFYVYPTVSGESSDYADMTAGREEYRTAHGQAGRLSSQCRLFAPVYRQLTGAGLERALNADKPIDWNPAYLDVRDAWRAYLAHDNHGRGVVIFGHSQGAILLQRLIAEEIDGKPAQKLMVAAFLAGDPGLPVPAGKAVGGVFKTVPLCQASAQTGCVYVWSSYAAGSPTTGRFFGRDPGHGLVAGCVNPAAPAGGSAPIDAFLPRPAIAPETDPPYVEAVGQMSAECVRDANGDVLTVTVRPDGRYAGALRAMLGRPGLPASWGLHVLDVSLVEGDMLARVAAESKSWTAR